MKSLWILYDIPWKIGHGCAMTAPSHWDGRTQSAHLMPPAAGHEHHLAPNSASVANVQNISTCESMKKYDLNVCVCGNVDFRKMMMINQRILVSGKPRLRARHHQGPNPPPELPERVHASIHICVFGSYSPHLSISLSYSINIICGLSVVQCCIQLSVMNWSSVVESVGNSRSGSHLGGSISKVGILGQVRVLRNDLHLGVAIIYVLTNHQEANCWVTICYNTTKV